MTDTAAPHNILGVLTFGQLLRHHLDEVFGGKQAPFARAAKTSPASVTNCLNSKNGPPLEQLDSWCDALKLRGKARTEFIHAAWRAKAWSQAEANPWLRQMESALARGRRHLRALTDCVAWQDDRIAELEEAMRRGGLTPPSPATDPPEPPSLDDEPEQA